MTTNQFQEHIHDTLFHAQWWFPEETTGVIVLVHGFGEHSGRYTSSVIPALNKAGFAVLGYDNFGHGLTEGKRGHCPSYDALLYALGTFIHRAQDHFPTLPVFLYGHSMGGNLVLNYGIRKAPEIAGIVATSPYLKLAFQPPKWKLSLGRLLLNLAPGITLPAGLEVEAISNIPEEVEKYKQDPLVHDKVSPMFSFPIMDAGRWAIDHAQELYLPTLLLHGTADRLIDVKGTQAFEENASNSTLHLFQEGYHELHHDVESEKAMKTIVSWLRNQLPKTP